MSWRDPATELSYVGEKIELPQNTQVVANENFKWYRMDGVEEVNIELQNRYACGVNQYEDMMKILGTADFDGLKKVGKDEVSKWIAFTKCKDWTEVGGKIYVREYLRVVSLLVVAIEMKKPEMVHFLLTWGDVNPNFVVTRFVIRTYSCSATSGTREEMVKWHHHPDCPTYMRPGLGMDLKNCNSALDLSRKVCAKCFKIMLSDPRLSLSAFSTTGCPIYDAYKNLGRISFCKKFYPRWSPKRHNHFNLGFQRVVFTLLCCGNSCGVSGSLFISHIIPFVNCGWFFESGARKPTGKHLKWCLESKIPLLAICKYNFIELYTFVMGKTNRRVPGSVKFVGEIRCQKEEEVSSKSIMKWIQRIPDENNMVAICGNEYRLDRCGRIRIVDLVTCSYRPQQGIVGLSGKWKWPCACMGKNKLLAMNETGTLQEVEMSKSSWQKYNNMSWLHPVCCMCKIDKLRFTVNNNEKQYFVTSSEMGEVVLWSFDEDRERKSDERVKILKKGSENVEFCRKNMCHFVSSKTNYLVYVENKDLVLWNLDEVLKASGGRGGAMKRFQKLRGNEVHYCVAHLDKKWILTIGNYGHIKFWNLQAPRRPAVKFAPFVMKGTEMRVSKEYAVKNLIVKSENVRNVKFVVLYDAHTGEHDTSTRHCHVFYWENGRLRYYGRVDGWDAKGVGDVTFL